MAENPGGSPATDRSPAIEGGPQPTPTRPPKSGGPIFILILSVLTLGGGCTIFAVPVSFFMGLSYFRRGSREGLSTFKSLGAAAMVISVLGVGVFLARAAAGIPATIQKQARIKQYECKKMLTDIAAAEGAYFAEHREYAATFAALSIAAPEYQRYTYILDPTGGSGSIMRRDVTRFGELVGSLPVKDAAGLDIGIFPDHFTAACVGNVDDDPDVDVWSVSSSDRNIAGSVVRAGQPFNDKSDVSIPVD